MKVLVADRIHEDGLNSLRKPFEVDYRPHIDRKELLETVKDYEALVVRSRTKVDKEVILAGSRLKVIVRAGAGIDNIDAKFARSRGVKVLNFPAALADSVAEHTLALILCLAKGITLKDRELKEGKWIKTGHKSIELKGKTLGVIGIGRIGRRVAKLSMGFGMKVLAYDIRKIRCKGVRFVEMERLLRESDMITIHVPLNEQTRGLIGRKEFELMKSGCFFVNTSRGGIVDEEALLSALKSGKVAGAGLDVFSEEPPKNLELIRMDNIVCTPHIAAQSEEAQKRVSIELAKRLKKLLGV